MRLRNSSEKKSISRFTKKNRYLCDENISSHGRWNIRHRCVRQYIRTRELVMRTTSWVSQCVSVLRISKKNQGRSDERFLSNLACRPIINWKLLQLCPRCADATLPFKWLSVKWRGGVCRGRRGNSSVGSQSKWMNLESRHEDSRIRYFLWMEKRSWGEIEDKLM